MRLMRAQVLLLLGRAERRHVVGLLDCVDPRLEVDPLRVRASRSVAAITASAFGTRSS